MNKSKLRSIESIESIESIVKQSTAWDYVVASLSQDGILTIVLKDRKYINTTALKYDIINHKEIFGKASTIGLNLNDF